MDSRHFALAQVARRAILSGAAVLASQALAGSALAHDSAGPVDPPAVPPPVALQLHDGSSASLQSLLTDRVTALQLVFTSCQATCPIQGALFAEVAKKLGERLKAARLLSVSIDPARDTPAALKEWVTRMGASPRWHAAQPGQPQLDALVKFLKSGKPGPDPHTAQVYFFNRKGQLVLRSVDFPPAREVIRSLEGINSQG